MGHESQCDEAAPPRLVCRTKTRLPWHATGKGRSLPEVDAYFQWGIDAPGASPQGRIGGSNRPPSLRLVAPLTCVFFQLFADSLAFQVG